jgi:hypothetical protein
MTTERERLMTWMLEKGITAAEMAATFRTRGNWVKSYLYGRPPGQLRKIDGGLMRFFAMAYGPEEYERVFGKLDDATCRVWAPYAVKNAVTRGFLPSLKTQQCYGCYAAAQAYHHESYHPFDWLCVVPLCDTCHMRHHKGVKRLTFGIVPTSVGLIRIAIAQPQPVAL